MTNLILMEMQLLMHLWSTTSAQLAVLDWLY